MVQIPNVQIKKDRYLRSHISNTLKTVSRMQESGRVGRILDSTSDGRFPPGRSLIHGQMSEERKW